MKRFYSRMLPCEDPIDAASDSPAENDWRAAIEARLASLESEIAELKADQTP